MSAYLHHGHVSPFRIAREAAQNQSDGAVKFLDELLIWRELAFNLCFHHDNVESISILPSWARNTLLSHQKDPRPALYSLETLEHAQTEDELWNAAQKSLLTHGELHNNVRMTWGKALLQWTRSPQEALDTLIHLNHKYALDGSDPNSYGGLLWCMGLFDRPFTPEQSIYGTVRTRPTEHHQKRIDLRAYKAHVDRTPRSSSMHVAIIGAGISGLAAARTLQNNGIQVSVFDKSRGPGGRMATRRVDDLAFDHGAQYFTVRDDRFRKQVDSWIEDHIVAEWHGQIGTSTRGHVEGKEVSPTRYVGIPRMSAVTRHMARELDITYLTRINKAEYKEQQWTLTDEAQNTVGSYDAIIVTTPPPQALPFLSHSSSLRKDVESAHMQPCWAVLVSFEQPLAIPFDGVFPKESPLSWMCRNNSKPDRPQIESWVLHGSPEWSAKHIEDAPEDVLKRLLTAFFDTTGLPVVAPYFAKAHRWRYALAETPLLHGCLWDAETQLAVCGDWCNGSRVEGAYLSGIAAAGRISGIPDELPQHQLDVQLSIPGL